MSNTVYKKYISVLLIVMLLLILQSITVPAITIAEESSNALEEYRQLYEATDVLDDLEGVDLSGYEDMETISVISFNEFGYTKSDLSGYGIYMYVYNSTGNPIVNYSLNRVQISMDGSKYDKYSMTVLDKNDEGTIYKVKISLTSDSGTNIKSFVRGTDERVYTVSGMEWATSMDGLNDYAVSYKFKYTGFASFEEGTESTLSCTVEQQDTVLITGLEDRQTVYRTDMDNPNMQSHNQVNSVYFAIDNYFLQTYGMLQSIEAEWWEYRTNPIVVTNDEELYNALTAFLHEDIDDHTCDLDYYLVSQGGPTIKTWIYNQMIIAADSDLLLKRLDWLFHTSSWDQSIENYVVESSELEEFRFSYEQSQIANFEEDNGYSYCTDLFNKEVGEGRTAGYNRKVFNVDDPDSMINFDEYEPGYRGWDLWKNIFGWEDEFDAVLKDQAPFLVINADNRSEYLSGSDKDISDRLLIAEEDVSAFTTYCSKSIANGESVVLFRFACTEYEATNVVVGKYTEHTLHMSIGSPDQDTTFTAEENVFLNFDIMTLGFYDGYNYTVIPVVSSPVDIISDIVGPALPGNGWSLMDYIYFALMVIVAVLILVVLYGLLDMISNSIMRAPARNNKNYNSKRRRR